MDDSESDTILQNAALSHCALVHAVRSLNSKAAVIKGDHRKERTETHEFKIYWPLQLQHVRRTRGVSNDELISELSDELYPPSKHDYPKRCLHSGRKRLLVRELSYSEMVVLKSIIGRYVDHMVENPASFLQTILCVVRIGDISTSGIFHIRKKTDYTYIVMTNTVIPQISHEILHKFLLSTKVVTPVRAYVYGASTQETFSLDHELAMNPKERKIALEQLDRDINLLQSLNLDNYCIFYVIALREKAYIMQLPGAPYGPEIDGVIEFDRKDTIPHRHDIRYGAHATPAQLIPVPLKNYEFIERLVNSQLRNFCSTDQSRLLKGIFCGDRRYFISR